MVQNNIKFKTIFYEKDVKQMLIYVSIFNFVFNFTSFFHNFHYVSLRTRFIFIFQFYLFFYLFLYIKIYIYFFNHMFPFILCLSECNWLCFYNYFMIGCSFLPMYVLLTYNIVFSSCYGISFLLHEDC